MTLLVPRISREAGLEILWRARHLAMEDVGESLPESPPFIVAPVGGRKATEGELSDLRDEVLALAQRHGFPGASSQEGRRVFDGEAGSVLRERLDLSASEASSEGVWTYLTCCWLLDVALWRWAHTRGGGDGRRYWGDLDRNTFRRLWWRVEVLGSGSPEGAVLWGLREDELVSVMERPSLARHPRLARAVAKEFHEAIARSPALERQRMHVMRDLTKRLLRLTPFTELGALGDDALSEVVVDLLRQSAEATGVEGFAPAVVHAPDTTSARIPVAESMVSAGVDFQQHHLADEEGSVTHDDLATVALELVARTGRVSSTALREAVPGTDLSLARAVLTRLVESGHLERRGQTRGTHYIAGERRPVRSDEGRKLLKRIFRR